MYLQKFNRSLAWLARALQADTQAAPTNYELESVKPVVDVVQGGWALAEFQPVYNKIHPAGTAGAQYTAIAGMQYYGFVVVAGSLTHAGGAAAVTASLQLKVSVATGSTTVPYAVTTSIAQDTTQGWNVLNYGQPLWVPPGCSLMFNAPTTGGGETVTLHLLYAQVPAGFNPR